MIEVEIPQIEVSQEKGHGFHKQYMYLFPMSALYGRLNLRNLDFAARHHYLNQLIRDVYIEHGLGKKIIENEVFYSYDLQHYTYKINIETIIYWLRKTCDEIISLYYYAEYFTVHKKEPTSIYIDCIGRLLKEKPEFKTTISSHLNFLSLLNEVSNSYKHSLVNNEAGHLIGVEEPSIVAFQMKNNDSRNQVVYHSYSLKNFINYYSAFFELSAKFFSEQRFLFDQT